MEQIARKGIILALKANENRIAFELFLYIGI
jgi:hypothetical protein